MIANFEKKFLLSLVELETIGGGHNFYEERGSDQLVLIFFLPKKVFLL